MEVLFLSPHIDDAENGAGGTIAKHIERGNEVHILVFSASNPKRQLKRELDESMKVLGCENYRCLKYPTRSFPEYRQGILEEMVAVRKELNPDVVYCPASSDTHQDHEVISREAMRAYREYTLYGYEVYRNDIAFYPQRFERLTTAQAQKKIDALNCYESQKSLRWHFREEYWRALLTLRGLQAQCVYAEAFEVIREIA